MRRIGTFTAVCLALLFFAVVSGEVHAGAPRMALVRIYEIAPPLALTGETPTVIIRGEGFTPASGEFLKVFFDGVELGGGDFAFISDNEIQATLPPGGLGGPGSYPVTGGGAWRGVGH